MAGSALKSGRHGDAYVEKLRDKGVAISRVVNHDDSETTVAKEMHDELERLGLTPDAMAPPTRLLNVAGKGAPLATNYAVLDSTTSATSA